MEEASARGRTWSGPGEVGDLSGGGTTLTGAPGTLVVVSGPGGVGKGTVVAELRRRLPDLAVSVSATTRAPRAGEVAGRDYHFLSPDQFTEMAEAGGFLEWAEFGGQRYGTPWSSVADALQGGATVLLEIDVQGAVQVRERFPEATLIFIAPPDLEALRRRLQGRGTDSPERITERLAIAERELARAEVFDHVLVNDDLDTTVRAVAGVLERLRRPGGRAGSGSGARAVSGPGGRTGPEPG